MILFLDIDGVLHPLDADPDRLFCCASRLWVILRRHPQICVVFSTAWRQRLDVRALIDYTLCGGGEDLAPRFIGCTPELHCDEDYQHRRLECEAWLAENDLESAPWLALDDTPSAMGFAASPNVYIVDPQHGLRDQDVEAVAARIRSLMRSDRDDDGRRVKLYINPRVLSSGPPDAWTWLRDALGHPQIISLPSPLPEVGAGEWIVIDDDPADYTPAILNSRRFFLVSRDRGLTQGARAFAVAREIAARFGPTPASPPDAPFLFLDFDGVTHGLNGPAFGKREFLWQILLAVPACRVVFSTAWRDRLSVAELTSLATAGGGEDLAGRFVGATPILDEVRKATRQAEITTWLEANGHAETHWLAIDDEPGLFEPACQHLILCPPSGLNEAVAEAALRRLRPTLFLDFDGVTHPEGLGPDVSREFECLPHLWAILRAVPAAQVVFSTSWRSIHTFDELVDFVTRGGGEDLADRFIGVTPEIPRPADAGDYRRREAECLAWRENAGHIGDWLAIDDIHHWFSAGSRNAYITDFKTGLTGADVPAIIDRLSRKEASNGD